MSTNIRNYTERYGKSRKEITYMYVEMKNIYKSYGDFLASDNVSFGVEKGSLWRCLVRQAVARRHFFV